MAGRKIEDEAEARSCLKAAVASGEGRAVWARRHGIDGRSLNAWRVNLEAQPMNGSSSGPASGVLMNLSEKFAASHGQPQDKMAAKAPPDLPGAPLDVSHGTRRRWRWDPSRLSTWASAYQAWKVETERKAKPLASRRTTARSKASTDGVVDWNAVARGR